MNGIRTVFLDLDGVLVDFHSVVFARDGISPDAYPWPGEWDYVRRLGRNAKAYWDGLDDAFFWAGLPWTSFGKQMLHYLELCFGPSNICLLTSAGWMPNAAAGKIRWIKRELPDYANRLILAADKSPMARPGALLIDDGDHNIDQFQHSGGRGILVPRPWNSNHGVAGCPAAYVHECIDSGNLI